MELEKLTALQLADKIKKHEVSVLDGVKDVFSKIEEKDNRIHAYLDTYKKEAYARAKEVEKGIEDGTYTGPLALPEIHGIQSMFQAAHQVAPVQL